MNVYSFSGDDARAIEYSQVCVSCTLFSFLCVENTHTQHTQQHTNNSYRKTWGISTPCAIPPNG